MTTPPEEITITCPDCGHVYKDWYRASINLALDDFGADYLNRRRRRPVRCAGSHMTLERWLSVETAMGTRSSRCDRRNILQRCPSRHGNDRHCSTNRHWPARCQPTGFSPVDAIRHWSAELGHPIEELTAEAEQQVGARLVERHSLTIASGEPRES